MKIVTCVSNIDQIGYVNGLVASCRFFNLNLVTLQSKNWLSHRQKDILFKDYLLTIDSEEIVFFTDAYDVLILSDEKEILEKYSKLLEKGKIVISADSVCSPEVEFAKYFDQRLTGYNYINTGGMIGKSCDFLNILNKVIRTQVKDKSDKGKFYSWSNQYLWTKTIMENPNLVIIDYNCEIFQTMTTGYILDQLFEFKNHEPELSFDEDLYKRKSITNAIENVLNEIDILENGRAFNKNTKTTPLDIHFNSEINKLTMFMKPFVGLVEKYNE
jgi:hypothetical protein